MGSEGGYDTLAGMVETEVKKPIPLDKLGEHIKELQQPLKDHPTYTNFTMEFEAINERSRQLYLSENYYSSGLLVNQPKNRYENILPPERTRVKLTPKEGVEGSDYINANWINGLIPNSEKQYIAAQGPTSVTIPDFWRMIWETNSCVILMLAKEIEDNKLKCERYWPIGKKPFTAGEFEITEESEEKTNEMIVRHLKLTDTQSGKSRDITQYQYMAWPDHGLPESTTAFLNLQNLAEKANHTNGPFLVHCSAGVGRTGTFCCIHSILQKLAYDKKKKKKLEVNVPEVVLSLRSQRSKMIQTEDQYQFCYLAIFDGAKQFMVRNTVKDEEIGVGVVVPGGSPPSNNIPAPTNSDPTDQTQSEDPNKPRSETGKNAQSAAKARMQALPKFD